MSNFNPTEHLSKLQGKQYLEVKYRLQWLREEHPDAEIDTELVKLEENFALFKATVTLHDGKDSCWSNGGKASGYGSETAKDFRDFIEKAETKAIGRALAALGYGTQFCDDFTTTDEKGVTHVVDAPVQRQAAQPAPAEPSRNIAVGDAITDAQKRKIWAVGKGLGWEAVEITAKCQDVYHCAVGELTKAQASAFIQILEGK